MEYHADITETKLAQANCCKLSVYVAATVKKEKGDGVFIILNNLMSCTNLSFSLLVLVTKYL